MFNRPTLQYGFCHLDVPSNSALLSLTATSSATRGLTDTDSALEVSGYVPVCDVSYHELRPGHSAPLLSQQPQQPPSCMYYVASVLYGREPPRHSTVSHGAWPSRPVVLVVSSVFLVLPSVRAL